MTEHFGNDEGYVQEETLDIQAIIGDVLSHIWIVIIVSIITAVMAFSYSMFGITPMYRSRTTVYVLDNAETDSITKDVLAVGSQLTTDYAQIIKSFTVCGNVIESLQDEVHMSPGALSGSISVSTANDETRVLTISVTHSNPLIAQKLATAVREQASKQVESMDLPAIKMIDEASLPTVPYTPTTKKNTVIGFLAGFIVSVGIIVVRFLLDDNIKTEDDVKRRLGLSVLGVIPINEKLEGGKKKKKGIRKYIDRIGYSIKRRMRKHRQEGR